MIGWLGERKVQGILNRLDAKKYTCFHDVLLPIDGETTQIDHILIVGDRCFIIETKAHAGWIFGKINDQQWTQSFNRHSKFSFQNPIRQNYKHVLAVKQYIKDLEITAVVVFTRATLKSQRIGGVLYSRELKAFLLNHGVNKSIDNNASIQSLQQAMITDKNEHQAHVRRLQAKHGGRWRIAVAKAFLFISLALFLSIFGMDTSPPTDVIRTKPIAPTYTQIQPQPIKTNQISKVLTPQKMIKPQQDLPSPIVKGFTKGKVIILDGKKLGILKVGEQTKDGWTLNAADATSAVFSHVSGKIVKLSARQKKSFN
ncbi:MAG: nuclease-related domain-containing protein [Mariprofundaceae bacterium]|nr:nuclease-related domain-containing protein [Mariprofundaceae bacterium]